MRIKYNFILFIILVLCSASCNDFLDELPDNRTELDTEEKITKILVTAYPTTSWNFLAEYYSDNTDDNGNKYSIFDRLTSEVYAWKDSYESGNDCAGTFWSYCYSAVSTANAALEAIDKMGNPRTLSAQRGEALMCRAYAHFALSYIFCEAWSEKNADIALGIPYATRLETTVNPHYERGTIGEVYEKIAKDIEEALPLIDDNLYTVPKYHFNKKAAYAFAARFYLYYRRYDKAIAYANMVLGDDASHMVRDWEALGKLSLNDDVQPNAYVDASDKANLLLKTARSFWGLYNGPLTVTCRYTHNITIAKNETCMSTGVWGDSNNLMKFTAANYTSVPKVIYRKFPFFYMEYTDPAQGIGYYNIVESVFNTDETLMVRAEAYAMLKQYDKALADMQVWVNSFTKSDVQLTTELVNKFYGDMEYYTPTKPTPKKALHPDFIVEEGTQENMIHFILHARRIVTLHEGLRWGDIKRYGITVHRRTVQNKVITVTDEMKADDPRRAIQIPKTSIETGMTPNPR
ncbi:MAG: RagB/SusD family nutrient uptake outer membrane protein [Paraprevotella sp.]|jgi:tetratricopeptide (TPR) repeat protein|nr:RagB/SusD family nutrient uptake outer membrane protein [Paraprevotella sp.]